MGGVTDIFALAIGGLLLLTLGPKLMASLNAAGPPVGEEPPGGGITPACEFKCRPMDSDPNRFRIDNAAGEESNNGIYYDTIEECNAQVATKCPASGGTGTPTPTTPTPPVAPGGGDNNGSGDGNGNGGEEEEESDGEEGGSSGGGNGGNGSGGGRDSGRCKSEFHGKCNTECSGGDSSECEDCRAACGESSSYTRALATWRTTRLRKMYGYPRPKMYYI